MRRGMEDCRSRLLESGLPPLSAVISAMPTYEYTCKKCGQTIEAVQSFSDKPLRKHKECGGELQKVFHARGVVFKGSGFYSTDSRTSKKSSTSSNGSTKKDESKTTPKSSAVSTTSTSDSSD